MTLFEQRTSGEQFWWFSGALWVDNVSSLGLGIQVGLWIVGNIRVDSSEMLLQLFFFANVKICNWLYKYLLSLNVFLNYRNWQSILKHTHFTNYWLGKLDQLQLLYLFDIYESELGLTKNCNIIIHIQNIGSYKHFGRDCMKCTRTINLVCYNVIASNTSQMAKSPSPTYLDHKFKENKTII